MKGWGLLGVVVCATALAMPAAAAAKTRTEVHRGTFSLHVELPDRGGWRMSITAENHRQVYFNANKGAMQIKYRVAGRASSRLLKADFGRFGRVDIKMDLEPEPSLSFLLRDLRGKDPRCHGKLPVELGGRYRGVVEFGGDPNVTPVSVQRGFASASRTFRTVCMPRQRQPADREDRAPELGIELIAATAHDGGRTTSFEAVGVGIRSQIAFGLASGSVHERLGRVRRVRSAVEFVEGDDLRFKPLGRRGHRVAVQPPRPFTGHASYLQRDGSPATWNGDLSVRLPGAGTVALAGPQFKAVVCSIKELSELAQLSRCLLKVRALRPSLARAPLLARLYGSGSHSQPLALARLSSLR